MALIGDFLMWPLSSVMIKTVDCAWPANNITYRECNIEKASVFLLSKALKLINPVADGGVDF